jgi:hypothetical protein
VCSSDLYTQPLGGTDVHHVDHRLRSKPFGTGMAHWGEVTTHFGCFGFEKIHFYTLDAISRHELKLPTYQLETMAFWLVPDESHMQLVRAAGLDVHSGLRAMGYATRMLLPLFMTCDTLDFSHSVGSVNSEWNAVFIYERYPHGLGFTEKAYERLHEIMPVVLDTIRNCPCADGCPCCVGKPLRQSTVWNVERGEASIPSKAAGRMILELMLGDGTALQQPETEGPGDTQAGAELRVEQALRRRLERMREPKLYHPIDPKPETAYPARESEDGLTQPDVAVRAERRRGFDKELRKRLAKRLPEPGLDPHTPLPPPPPGMATKHPNLPPTAFAERPAPAKEDVIRQGDALAAKARRMKRKGSPPS